MRWSSFPLTTTLISWLDRCLSTKYHHKNYFLCLTNIKGTLGLEVLDQLPEVEVLVLSVGGGGLMAGVAAYAKTGWILGDFH